MHTAMAKVELDAFGEFPGEIGFRTCNVVGGQKLRIVLEANEWGISDVCVKKTILGNCELIGCRCPKREVDSVNDLTQGN